jgi:L-ascorbate metabolism protein UlaG (beta-lactamase superfamily)
MLSSVVLLLAVGLIGALAGAALVGRAPVAPGAPSAGVAAQGPGVTVEFFGWSHYRLTSPTGKVIVTNPFINGNPDAAITLDEAIARGADLILVPNGHGDEQGQALQIAEATGARILTGGFELGTWFMQMGVPAAQVIRGNPGDTLRWEGITIRVLGGQHGSGLPRASESVYYGGPASSFMITFENGYTLYFTGSIAATMDMQWWADLYQPDAIIAHQSTDREPLDAAMTVKFMTTGNPNLRTVFPHHHRIQRQPGQQFTQADLRSAIQQLGVNVTFIDPEPLRPYTLTK